MASGSVTGSQASIGYRTTHQKWPAFDLTGFTKIVRSGGEMYEETRRSGRWEVLRGAGGVERPLYGVASHDKACPEGHYRYTVAVKASEEELRSAGVEGELLTIHIRESEWIVFELEHFGRQYGKFWQDNPYDLIRRLGWEFNWDVGLHIDVYAPSYLSDDDGMAFAMPVKARS